MNIKILKKSVLFSFLMASSVVSFAITSGNNTNAATNDTIIIPGKLENNNLNRTGYVNFVDIKSKIIVINKEQFVLAGNVQVYDGQITNKKYIRFLLNENKQIQEIWIMK